MHKAFCFGGHDLVFYQKKCTSSNVKVRLLLWPGYYQETVFWLANVWNVFPVLPPIHCDLFYHHVLFVSLTHKLNTLKQTAANYRHHQQEEQPPSQSSYQDHNPANNRPTYSSSGDYGYQQRDPGGQEQVMCSIVLCLNFWCTSIVPRIRPKRWM